MKNLSSALLVSMMFGCATVCYGQPWRSTALPTGYVIQEIAFADSAHGFLLAMRAGVIGVIYKTIDGGATWDSLGLIGGYPKEEPGLLVAASPEFAVLPKIDGNEIISNDSISFQPFVEGRYRTTSERLYGGRNGNRLASEVDQFGRVTGNYNVLSTSDAFVTTSQTGEMFNGGSSARAYFADKTHYWIAVAGFNGAGARIVATSDAAQTWTSLRPIDTTMAWSTVVGSGLDSLAAIGGSNHLSNLALSFDGGQTWRFDTTFHGHVLRASLTGGVWVVSGPGFYKADLRTTVFGQYFGNVVSRLTPEGWIHDSTTFIRDTITEMFWLDKDHGWITTVRDSVPYVYRYVPSSNRVKPRFATAAHLNLLDGYIQSDDFTPIEVYDMLGREQALPSTNRGVDTRSLPRGGYIAISSAAVLKFVVE